MNLASDKVILELIVVLCLNLLPS